MYTFRFTSPSELLILLTLGFRQSWFDLSAYADQLITLKFRFKSDSSLTSNFFGDNFRFAQSASTNATDPNLMTNTTLAESKPNGLPGAAIVGKKAQSAPQLSERLRHIFPLSTSKHIILKGAHENGYTFQLQFVQGRTIYA